MAALDRTKTTSRNATYVLSEAASSLGHNLDTVNTSRSSIHRARTKFRMLASTSLKSDLCAAVPVTVHWDGKLMEDLTTKKYVDRFLVLICGSGTEQLLGVPKLSSETGEVLAAAVVQCLKEWGIEERVVALCFDTTASNTGQHKGACTLIEQMLHKDLLYTACRHHIMELLIGAAFEQVLGVSSGPEINLFKRFQELVIHRP